MAEVEGPGVRDLQTVTPAGAPTAPMIDGVVVHTPITHLDSRGALFEFFNHDQVLGTEPVVWGYADTVRPGGVKGWARHEHKVDRYTLVLGELLVLLHDTRPDSPTRDVTQPLVLSPRGPRQLRIPTGVWHLLANLGPGETHFINLPSLAYDHEQPDRILLPWDTEELPVDVRDYLPKF